MGWTKRISIPLTCPSGEIVMVRRPGPDMALKAGKVGRILQRQATNKSNVDAQLAFIESLSDDEINKLMAFGRVMLVDAVTEPALSLNPREGQLCVDDVPLGDFWFIFTSVMNGLPEMPVKTKDGETTVEAVETFSDEQVGSPGTDNDRETVQ